MAGWKKERCDAAAPMKSLSGRKAEAIFVWLVREENDGGLFGKKEMAGVFAWAADCHSTALYSQTT